MMRWSKAPNALAPVYVRHDGARIHCGGMVSAPGQRPVMAYRHDDRLLSRCLALEPKTRRALMLFVDTAWPDDALPPPPRGLVLLSLLPMDTWVGRSIYHPLCQQGTRPYWRDADMPEVQRDPDLTPSESVLYCYDTGIVVDVVPAESLYGEGARGEPDRAFFKRPGDPAKWHGLQYSVDNLWTLGDR